MAENYQDAYGNYVSLEKLVRMEPDWACSRIRAEQARVAELEAQVQEARKIIADAIDYTACTYQCDTSPNCDNIQKACSCGRWVVEDRMTDWLARTAPKEQS